MAGADTELFSRVVSPRASHRAHGCLPSRVQGRVTFSFETPGEEGPSHSLLDVCFLCKTPLGTSRDIYMYRGDTPFCSEECRQEQMELDEAREREMSFRRRRHQAAAAKQAPPSARQALCKGASDAVVAS